MPPAEALDLQLMSSQLSAYGLKIIRKDKSDGGNDIVFDSHYYNCKPIFPQRGERPPIKFRVVKKPTGSAGRRNFQVHTIIGVSKEDEKFMREILKKHLEIDPVINMKKAKGKNPPKAILRALIDLWEFSAYEKYNYWPLDSLILKILRNTSQTAKGYGKKYREKKKKEAADKLAQVDATNSPVGVASTENQDQEQDGAQDDHKGDQEYENEDKEEHEGENGGNDGDEDIDEDTGEPEGKDNAMDISFKVPTLSGEPGGITLDEEELANELSYMSITLNKGNMPEETSSPANNIFLPQALSTPGPAHSRPHPFTPSLPPCRRLSKAPTVTGAPRVSTSNVSLSISKPPVSTTDSSRSPIPTKPAVSGSATPSSALHEPTPMVTTPAASIPTTPTSQQPSDACSTLPEGLTAEHLTQLAGFLAPLLAMFSPTIQAAVAMYKAATAISEPIIPPTSASAPGSAPVRARRPKAKTLASPALTKAAQMKEAVAKAKAVPIGEPFDNDEHQSNELSASESNRPIDPKRAVIPEAPGKHQVANSGPTKTSQKKTRVKAGMATLEEGESAPKAPAKQGGKGKGANKANRTNQTDPSGEAGIDAVPIAGAGGKGGKGRKNEKAPLNKDGAEGNPAGGRAMRGKAAKASVAEPVSKEQTKRATRSNKVTNTGAAAK